MGVRRLLRSAKVWAAAAALTLLGLAAAAASEGGKRVALVIGVANYQSVSPLKNTVNDADRMAATFERLGFDVVKALDPQRADFENALRAFGAKARTAEASVFFYAGHAIEVQGRNWLLPADARLETSRDLRFEAIDVEAVLDQAQAARIAVMFLDACRNNPFAEKLSPGTRGSAARGLARIDPAAGVLVAFATAPGQVALDGTGTNSPFTEALLKHIETPGLEIRQLMSRVRSDVRRATRDQVPWEQSALEGEFFFRAPAPTPVVALAPAPAAPAPVVAAPPPPPAPLIDPDALFWDSVRGSSNPADLAAYLERFPNGVYATLARNRIEQMRRQSAPPPAPVVEPPKPVAAAPQPAPTAPVAPVQPAAPPAAVQTAPVQPAPAQAAAVQAAPVQAAPAIVAAPTAPKPAAALAAPAQIALAPPASTTRETAPPPAPAKPPAAAPGPIAALAPASPLAPPPPALDRAGAIRQVKAGLRRIGCYAGEADEAWNAAARDGLARLVKASGKTLPKEPGPDLIAALATFEARACPLVCQRGFEAKGESCVEIVCAEGQIKDRNGVCKAAPVARPKPEAPTRPAARPTRRERQEAAPAPARPRPVVTRPRPEPSGGGGGRCFSAGGRQYCS